ncbi:hypothetical protein ACFY97_18595 [Streptomyces klenkii]|uniref:hypothetical protein n=1 Tax=Streptomyces klenkii TaxID=1420899 RepID=UPI0036E6777A
MPYLLSQYGEDCAALFKVDSAKAARDFCDDLHRHLHGPSSWDWITDKNGDLRQIYTRDLDDAMTGAAPGIIREIDFDPAAGPGRLHLRWDLEPGLDGARRATVFPREGDPTPIGFIDDHGPGRSASVLAIAGEDWLPVPGLPEAVAWLHGFYTALAQTCS